MLHRSKTDQEGEGAALYLAPATMQALNAIRQDAPDGAPVFGLSASQIARRIKAAAEAAGLTGRFSGHSCRVGMAQDLAATGTELPALMQAGRWGPPQDARRLHPQRSRWTRGRGPLLRTQKG